jgi:putative ABC transport system substrate-binding protein
VETRLASRRAILIGAVSLVMTGRAGAQPRNYRMGYLGPGSAPTSATSAPSQAAFFSKLEELGYRAGHNLVVDRRFADGRLDRLPALAAELVALKPDILYAIGTQATLATSKATRTIPIVFVSVTDPEGLGIVKSLRQPGTNAAGLSNQADEFQVKLLQLVKDAFPAASDVAILYNPLNTPEVRVLPALRQAGVTLGLNLRMIEARTPEDLVPAFKLLKARPPDVLYVVAGPLMDTERERVVALANGQRQAAVYGLPGFVEAGGLMSYSFSLIEQHRAAATFIDKILRGANPAALPVEQPTRFELVLNLRTAKAQGISFPSAMLLRADRVIEGERMRPPRLLLARRITVHSSGRLRLR